jgi:hypothetical protein
MEEVNDDSISIEMRNEIIIQTEFSSISDNFSLPKTDDFSDFQWNAIP